jgi:hypothetical protein
MKKDGWAREKLRRVGGGVEGREHNETSLDLGAHPTLTHTNPSPAILVLLEYVSSECEDCHSARDGQANGQLAGMLRATAME